MGDGKQTIKIVLTGGPCAGKTTAYSWIRETFGRDGWHVMFVPEAATELILGGVSPSELPLEDFQRAVVRSQIQREEVFEEAARSHPSDKVLIVCDRGVMDNEAYLGRQGFARLLVNMGYDRITLRDGYDAVLHLVTAADGAEEAYTLANNAARYETAEEARDVDARIVRAWTGHPHLRVIGNSGTFEDKMRHVMREVAVVLGEPEPMEIERKYLIGMPDEEWMESQQGHSRVDIIQTYLRPDSEGGERRIRQRGRDGSYVYTLTTKHDMGGDGLRRVEYERPLSQSEYLSLLMDADTERTQIRKVRHLIVCDGQYLEIDVYPFDDEHAIMEVELPDEDAEVRMPEGIRVIREVTGDARYRNVSLATRVARKPTLLFE